MHRSFVLNLQYRLQNTEKQKRLAVPLKNQNLNQECSDGTKRKILQSQNVIYLCCHFKCKTLE